jgi:CRISPR-associated protein Cmr5
MPLTQTLDQQRAKLAWDVVEEALALSPRDQREFGTEAKKLPARVLASGLGQALAFLSAKAQREGAPGTGMAKGAKGGGTAKGKAKKPGVRALLDGLDGLAKARLRVPTDRDFLAHLIENDAAFLRRATAEALAWLQWVGRFAEARKLTDEQDGDGGNG